MKKQILAAAVLAVASFGAYAAEGTTDSIAPSYTYVDAGFARTSLEFDANSDSVDFDGWNVRGSYGFAEQFHVFGGYNQVDNNDFIDLKLTEYQVGLGWHPKVSDNADALVEVSYINQEAKASLFGISDSADVDLYRVSAGFRGALNKVLVGTIKANYTDGSDVDGEFSPTLGLEARINKTWSIVGEAEVSEGTERYLLNVRASF
jgi:hypothetical protein